MNKKIFVALLALAAVCHADDDDDDDDSDEVMTVSQYHMAPLIPQVRTINHPAISIPAHVPLVKTVPTPTWKTGAAVVHSDSASPAVMKIPKPGIKFDVSATHGVPLPIAHTPAAVHVPAPAPAIMPKTAHVPVSAPVVPAPAPVVPAAAPAVTVKAAEIPALTSSFQSIFQNMNALPLPYYSSGMSFGVPLPGVAPQAVAVPETTSIQYASAPAVSLPVVASAPRASTYWRDVINPAQMTNFLDLNTGGFSYVNVLGDVATSRHTPLVVSHPFKAIHSLFPGIAGIKDTGAVIAV